jgi:hypothetical protein
MYYTSVVPILDYCSGVWGFSKHECCEKIQLRACRYFLGIHQKAPIGAIIGDMGWQDCQKRRHLEMIRLWNRLMKLDQNRITRIVFDWDHELCHNNWSSEVKTLFSESGKIDVFNDKLQCNLNEMQNYLDEKMQTEWSEYVKEKPKLRTYIQFKSKIDTEDYVKYCMSRQQRSFLAQIRAGILPLHIETGRFQGKEEKDRVCKVCNTDAIESEFHFICKCEKYLIIRQDMYSSVSNEHFVNLNDNEKFIFLLSNEWKKVAIFIEKAWKIRHYILYQD